MKPYMNFRMIRCLPVLLIAGALLMCSLTSSAVVDIVEFDTESQRHRYMQLSEELRCPKCQNQNLAGSDSQIAGDLRRELHRLLLEGKTDREIKDYMVARYGNFVLYKPPLQNSTLVLWGLPIFLLLVGAGAVFFITKQRRLAMADATASLSDDDHSRLEAMLAAQGEDTETSGSQSSNSESNNPQLNNNEKGNH